MRKPNSTHVTPLSYSVFVTAIVPLGLAIAEITLTAITLRAFRRFDVQFPGSSLAEWKFVSLDPSNIDDGTTSAKFVVGTTGLVAALVPSLWIALQWWGVGKVKVRRGTHESCQRSFADVLG